MICDNKKIVILPDIDSCDGKSLGLIWGSNADALKAWTEYARGVMTQKRKRILDQCSWLFASVFDCGGKSRVADEEACAVAVDERDAKKASTTLDVTREGIVMAKLECDGLSIHGEVPANEFLALCEQAADELAEREKQIMTF